MERICYRKITQYKYQIHTSYQFRTNIQPAEAIHTDFVQLKKNGLLLISENYAWDGPSAPTIDTKTFMRGSLVHDALYQLIRLGYLPEESRDQADLLLKKICLEDGMNPFRASYVYRAVHWFGRLFTRKYKHNPDELDYAP